MTLAIASRGTPVLPMPRSPVPPVFEKAFEGSDEGIPGYEQPYVIVERLALVAPETLQTRFYTSAYAAQPDFKPLGDVRFRFPNTYSLLELVEDLHSKLSAMELKNNLVPPSIDEKTEFAAIQHILQSGPGSGWFDDYFQSMFYAIFGAMVNYYDAIEINQK